MTNIRHKSIYPEQMKIKSSKELHECCDCKGCICEDICEKRDKEITGEEKVKKDERRRLDFGS